MCCIPCLDIVVKFYLWYNLVFPSVQLYRNMLIYISMYTNRRKMRVPNWTRLGVMLNHKILLNRHHHGDQRKCIPWTPVDSTLQLGIFHQKFGMQRIKTSSFTFTVAKMLLGIVITKFKDLITNRITCEEKPKHPNRTAPGHRLFIVLPVTAKDGKDRSEYWP